MLEANAKTIGIGVSVVIVSLIVGGLIGTFANPKSGGQLGECPLDKNSATEMYTNRSIPYTPACYSEDVHKINDMKTFFQFFNETFDVTKFEQHLALFSSLSHVAGDKRTELEMTAYIKDQFEQYGFDAVEVLTYDVLLSVPAPDAENTFQILSKNSDDNLEQIYSPETEFSTDINNPSALLQPFAAYSRQFDNRDKPFTRPFFVHTAKPEDFEYLYSKNNEFSKKPKICIAKLSSTIDPASQVRNCESQDCNAVLLYPDRKDVDAINNFFLSREATRLNAKEIAKRVRFRSSILRENGDPWTPGFPAKTKTIRLNSSLSNLPQIPVHLLNLNDATAILTKLRGAAIDSNWNAGLDNNIIKTGPFEKTDVNDYYLTLSINNEFVRATVNNVVGYIYGGIEPDRQVLIGSHRDSFTNGSTDSASSAAIHLEIARMFGEKRLKDKSWRPRRTLAFASWSGTKFGAIGSTEYIEDKLEEIKRKTVAYVDVANCATGSSLAAQATPSLRPLIRDVTSDFENKWAEKDGSQMKINFPFGDTDASSFQNLVGIPTASIYHSDKPLANDASIGSAIVGTPYDTFEVFKEVVDPNYEKSLLSAMLNAAVIFRLTEDSILPIFANESALEIGKALQTVKELNVKHLLGDTDISQFEQILNDASTFENITEIWHDHIEKMTKITPLGLRTLNDRVQGVEQQFLIHAFPETAHAFYGPSVTNKRNIIYFPTITDTLRGIPSNETAETLPESVINMMGYFLNTYASIIQRSIQQLIL